MIDNHSQQNKYEKPQSTSAQNQASKYSTLFGSNEPVDSRVSKDEKTLAMLAHALSFVEGGIIGPLIIYLIKRKESEFVAFHALESLYFGLLFIGAAVVTLITCIGPLICLAAYFVFEVIASIRASEGKWYKLPLAGSWAFSSHPMPPFSSHSEQMHQSPQSL